ncbi:pglyrp1 isoform X3 [Brachionus plicatilis]|uniref:Pglyrp1 isoform X3 n=1 Tax=Brachionus plicatilis TaxID=10195 RepID=A0A3M7T0N1_BRAPC|nr:pglyrp1 isoform X3 [Brachionus plicatilis]
MIYLEKSNFDLKLQISENILSEMKPKTLFLIFLFIYIKSQTISGNKGYTEFEIGNLNVLISVPHDGDLLPNEIADRNEEDGGLVIDYNTRRFAKQLNSELFSLLGKKPFMVLNNLHRRKMDPNRTPQVSCSNRSLTLDCQKTYQEYHNYINKFKRDMSLLYKQLLIIDLHGQSHKENWTEIGYLLTEQELNQPVLKETDKSSINALKASKGFSLERTIRGDVSLGKYIEKVVPSPSIRGPGNGDYYSGGYITAVHKSPNVNTIQIELAYYLRSSYIQIFMTISLVREIIKKHQSQIKIISNKRLKVRKSVDNDSFLFDKKQKKNISIILILSFKKKHFFCITTSSVPSECLFSHAGQIQTDLRSRLDTFSDIV